MATILGRSVVVGSKGGCERWKAAQYGRRCGSSVRFPLKLRTLSCSACWKRRALSFPILAVGSDIGDPESLTGDDYDLRYGGSGSGSGSDFEGDSFYHQSSPGSINEKLEAASQLSESVPSSSVDRLEESGGDDDDENPGGRGGGGGGSGGGSNSGDETSGDKEDKNKKLSASQKLTLAYAVLVAAGGVIGYVKSGSVKSLLSGAISGLVLYYVYTQLPVNPTFASSLGLGVSGMLLAVMGARFKRSGKLFPAGVLSFVSLVMTGGYIHGILRSSHA